jgi:hypothetical protein
MDLVGDLEHEALYLPTLLNILTPPSTLPYEIGFEVNSFFYTI